MIWSQQILVISIPPFLLLMCRRNFQKTILIWSSKFVTSHFPAFCQNLVQPTVGTYPWNQIFESDTEVRERVSHVVLIGIFWTTPTDELVFHCKNLISCFLKNYFNVALHKTNKKTTTCCDFAYMSRFQFFVKNTGFLAFLVPYLQGKFIKTEKKFSEFFSKVKGQESVKSQPYHD